MPVDKEKVLPLVPPLSQTRDYELGAYAQREADWKRVKELVEALLEIRDGSFRIYDNTMSRDDIAEAVLSRFGIKKARR